MKVIRNPQTLQKICLKLAGKNIGLVPTMGALHAGHLSLIKKSVAQNDVTIVSIFVNPKQFAPGEDYLKYPRPLKKDLGICRAAKVDYVFAPSPEDMYSNEHLTYVEVLKTGERLCGMSREGHFKGVATVVAKLFNITFADNAYFGLKDFQQLKVIQQMARDLNFKSRVIACPTVRESDGLAMSSRNVYLTAPERAQALKISAALQNAKGKKIQTVKNFVKNEISKIKNVKIDYIELLDAHNLQKTSAKTKEIVIAVAVWVGKTRLIDNMIFKV